MYTYVHVFTCLIYWIIIVCNWEFYFIPVLFYTILQWCIWTFKHFWSWGWLPFGERKRKIKKGMFCYCVHLYCKVLGIHPLLGKHPYQFSRVTTCHSCIHKSMQYISCIHKYLAGRPKVHWEINNEWMVHYQNMKVAVCDKVVCKHC